MEGEGEGESTAESKAHHKQVIAAPAGIMSATDNMGATGIAGVTHALRDLAKLFLSDYPAMDYETLRKNLIHLSPSLEMDPIFNDLMPRIHEIVQLELRVEGK